MISDIKCNSWISQDFLMKADLERNSSETEQIYYLEVHFSGNSGVFSLFSFLVWFCGTSVWDSSFAQSLLSEFHQDVSQMSQHNIYGLNFIWHIFNFYSFLVSKIWLLGISESHDITILWCLYFLSCRMQTLHDNV